MVELLPAERDIRVLQPKAQFDARTLQKHDAAIVVCPRERAEAVLGKLPSAALWQRLYRDARSRGPVTMLSARITPAAIPVVIAFARNTASAFERLMLGARAWKELAPPASRTRAARNAGPRGATRAPRHSKRWWPRRSPRLRRCPS